ncbi:MAG: uracil-DNA glycosylase [Alphaproteobacteria bacterium]|nr:uracil-DNA glycosylase [Alphaproteobacteria bacterium]
MGSGRKIGAKPDQDHACIAFPSICPFEAAAHPFRIVRFAAGTDTILPRNPFEPDTLLPLQDTPRTPPSESDARLKNGGPGKECPHCPRLVAFRAESREAHPDWHNAPVPSFGAHDAKALIVGLAPGLKGANRTGRPFTGDYAGDLLYGMLGKYGFTEGDYRASPEDGLRLVDCRITNAVRCVPPGNKPTPSEIRACGQFLKAEIAAMPKLRFLLALGLVAHNAVLAAFGLKRSPYPFRHGACYALPNGLLFASSYHCSRYNTNTGRLTEVMFEDVIREMRAQLYP